MAIGSCTIVFRRRRTNELVCLKHLLRGRARAYINASVTYRQLNFNFAMKGSLSSLFVSGLTQRRHFVFGFVQLEGEKYIVKVLQQRLISYFCAQN